MKKVYMIILGALVSVFVIGFTIWQLFFNPQHLPSGDIFLRVLHQTETTQ